MNYLMTDQMIKVTQLNVPLKYIQKTKILINTHTWLYYGQYIFPACMLVLSIIFIKFNTDIDLSKT